MIKGKFSPKYFWWREKIKIHGTRPKQAVLGKRDVVMVLKTTGAKCITFSNLPLPLSNLELIQLTIGTGLVSPVPCFLHGESCCIRQHETPNLYTTSG